jgi:putative transposase
MLQDEFSKLKKRYWGQHLWARGYLCATVGTVNEETIRLYIKGQQVEGDDVFEIEESSTRFPSFSRKLRWL